jgi:hypothetical protein
MEDCYTVKENFKGNRIKIFSHLFGNKVEIWCKFYIEKPLRELGHEIELKEFYKKNTEDSSRSKEEPLLVFFELLTWYSDELVYLPYSSLVKLKHIREIISIGEFF